MNLQPTRSGNRILELLPSECTERLLSVSSMVDLPLGSSLFERDRRPRFLYFLTSGIASIVFNSERGTSVELSTEGREGLVGWVYLLGPAATAGDCTMQVSGAGYRIPLTAMQREFEETPEIRRYLLAYVQHQTTVANQVLACNRLHRAEARFSRWLLMVSDRIGSDDLAMTQEFMSVMLGTRRTTVAEVAADLARAGAVEGRRGGLRIADRGALESRACECYKILKARYSELFSQLAPAS
jgi:CRP-like cAMP-binding protein